jgi:hypothetical protein
MVRSCQSCVSRRCEVNRTSISTPFYCLFFKVDEAIKSVIDSYYLTKGKKRADGFRKMKDDKYNG